jgi:putative ABC transport system permease protein
VRRYLWGELRHRGSRTLALLLGILVATASFTVLTGTTQTSRLEVLGTVTKSFRPAYDVLVRPKGSTTPLERREGLVRPNYLSGIFGGVTLEQYQKIKRIPGIEVAAPIAMIGYVLQTVQVPVDLTQELGPVSRQVFRVTVRRTTDHGLTQLVDIPSSYVYVTSQPLQPVASFSTAQQYYGPKEKLESGRVVTVCPSLTRQPPAAGPFDRSARESTVCSSRRSGESSGPSELPTGHVGALVDWPFPFLIAAVDPAAEAELAHVDRALTQGRYLESADVPVTVQNARGGSVQVPVLVSTQSYADDRNAIIVSRLGPGAAQAMIQGSSPSELARRLATERGPVVLEQTIDATVAYQRLLKNLSTSSHSFVDSYWTVGPTRYEQRSDRGLAPVPVRNPDSVWASQFQSSGYVHVPIDAADTSFRSLRPHVGSNTGQTLRLPLLGAVGRFDPAKLPGFSALSAVPLETYNAPQAAPADPRARRLLGGRDLLPNGNFAGYLESPPLLLTTLKSLPAFTSPAVFGEGTNAAAPISVVRVRVADVTGPDPVSRERIRSVAQQISQRTGLDVDITAGSSPTPMLIDLPAGKFGRPALKLQEGWVKKGVAVALLSALDRKSLVLFVLILLVCALFVTNAASAAVRTRRTQLGVLACLGWRTNRLFGAVLAEVGLVGLAAGVLGSLLALPLSTAFGLQVSPWRAVVAVPAAVLLALFAGLVPAWRASRAEPGAAVRPAVFTPGCARGPRNVVGLALTNLARVPGRSLLGAASLAVGVCALTLLLGLTLAFRGVLVGSLLGDAISVQIRAVDYVAVAATMLLGTLAVADVLYLDIRERAAEFSTLRATGWREGPLARLVALEGLGMGLAGSLAGAILGLAAVAAFAGNLPPLLLFATTAAVSVGTLLAAAAAVVPILLLRRLPTAQLLAEE